MHRAGCKRERRAARRAEPRSAMRPPAPRRPRAGRQGAADRHRHQRASGPSEVPKSGRTTNSLPWGGRARAVVHRRGRAWRAGAGVQPMRETVAKAERGERERGDTGDASTEYITSSLARVALRKRRVNECAVNLAGPHISVLCSLCGGPLFSSSRRAQTRLQNKTRVRDSFFACRRPCRGRGPC